MSGDLVVPALYEADVAHTRSSPLAHHFRYRAAYWLVDLDQLPQPRGLAGWCTQVRSQDHMDIRHLLAEQGLAADRVLMLSGARTLGYVFNPITVFWCHDDTNKRAQWWRKFAIPTATAMRTCSNPTPPAWPRSPRRCACRRSMRAEELIGSGLPIPPPRYRCRSPWNARAKTPFVATLHGMRQTITMRTILRSVVRHSSARTRILIQLQGLRLWGRGLRVQAR